MKDISGLLERHMDENAELYLGPMDLPDFQIFLDSVEPEKRIIKEELANESERKAFWRRGISFAVGLMLLVCLVFGFVPEARAALHALGIQIEKIFSNTSESDITFNLSSPDIILVDRRTFDDSELEILTYEFSGITVFLYIDNILTPSVNFMNQKSNLNYLDVLGEEMEYYLDKDGYIGAMIYDQYTILLSINSSSKETFEQIAKSLQIVHNS